MKWPFSYERQILCEKFIQIYGLYKIIDIFFSPLEIVYFILHFKMMIHHPRKLRKELKQRPRRGALLSKAFIHNSGPFAQGWNHPQWTGPPKSAISEQSVPLTCSEFFLIASFLSQTLKEEF